ncbi:MAG: hypothetical protein AB7V44_18565 [Pseudonocardia sp.]
MTGHLTATVAVAYGVVGALLSAVTVAGYVVRLGVSTLRVAVITSGNASASSSGLRQLLRGLGSAA